MVVNPKVVTHPYQVVFNLTILEEVRLKVSQLVANLKVEVHQDQEEEANLEEALLIVLLVVFHQLVNLMVSRHFA